MTKLRKLELSGINVKCLIAECADGVHRFWHGVGNRDYLADMEVRHAHEKAHEHKIRTSTICDVCADYDIENAWCFYVADCFDPPMFLVFGRSFEGAYQTFVTEFEHLIKIDDSDLADYGDEYNVNDNGTPIDDEAVQAIKVNRLVLTTTDYPPSR